MGALELWNKTVLVSSYMNQHYEINTLHHTYKAYYDNIPGLHI
jgi:hypothetical protein